MIIIGSNGVSRDIEQAMWTYIPDFYGPSHVVEEIIRVDALEMENYNAAVLDVLNQFFVETATWGLSTWEQIVGIQVNPPNLSYEQRRSLIISKMRGNGSVTIALIQNVAESFNNGQVDVTPDNTNYTVDIKFVGEKGIPDNLPGIEAALRALIPAHLGITYTFTYTTWGDLDSKNETWSTAGTMTWTQFVTQS